MTIDKPLYKLSKNKMFSTFKRGYPLNYKISKMPLFIVDFLKRKENCISLFFVAWKFNSLTCLFCIFCIPYDLVSCYTWYTIYCSSWVLNMYNTCIQVRGLQLNDYSTFLEYKKMFQIDVAKLPAKFFRSLYSEESLVHAYIFNFHTIFFKEI